MHAPQKPRENSQFNREIRRPDDGWKTGSEAVGNVSQTGQEVLIHSNNVLEKRNMETVFNEHHQQNPAKQRLFPNGTPIAFTPARQTRIENAEKRQA